MEEARRGTIAVTRSIGLINPKRNSEAISRQIDILRVTIGFTLLTASGCASIIRVLGLIPHIQVAAIISGLPVCKIINP